MMDDSKHTEAHDISNCDFTDTQSQETLRNLHKAGSGDGKSNENLEVKKGSAQISNSINLGEYANLTEEESQRMYDLKRHQQNITQQHIFTEEEKTRDDLHHIKDIYNDDDYGEEDDYEDGEKRAQTEGGDQDYQQQNYKLKQQQFSAEDRGQANKRKIASISMKPHLPNLKQNVPLALSSSDIFEAFVNISRKEQFQVIEMEQSFATAVNKEPFSLKRMFLRCIPFSEFKKDQPQESFISAIRLQISVNEIKCCRKITLKGLYGEFNRLQQFTNQFRANIHHLVSNLPQQQTQKKKKIKPNNYSSTSVLQLKPKRKNSNKIMSTIGNRKSMSQLGGGDGNSDDGSDQEGYMNKFVETSSLYKIHMILSSDQYTLGKNVAEYIEAFHMQYKSLRESAALLPQPMEGIIRLVNETVHTFKQEQNLGKETAKSLMPFCRPAVEQYIFSKLYDKLFAMYAIKNEKEDRIFSENGAIIKKKKASEIMAALGVKEKFKLSNNNNNSTFNSRMTINDHSIAKSRTMGNERHSMSPFAQVQDSMIKDHIDISRYDSHRSESTAPIMNSDNNNHNTNNAHNPNESLFNNSQNISTFGYVTGVNNGNNGVSNGIGNNKTELPYIEAIRSIEKIQQYTSPRDKLQCISESSRFLKIAVVDHWKGKLELSAKDDVLPLTIYIVAMAELSHPASEFSMLEDYLSIYDKGFEQERQLLIDFQGGVTMVNQELEMFTSQES